MYRLVGPANCAIASSGKEAFSERTSRYQADDIGWHKSESLMIPDNLRLLSLPPYSSELNPVEHIWDDLREKELHNRVFDSIDSLEDHLEKALHDMEHDHDRICSIVA